VYLLVFIRARAGHQRVQTPLPSAEPIKRLVSATDDSEGPGFEQVQLGILGGAQCESKEVN